MNITKQILELKGIGPDVANLIVTYKMQLELYKRIQNVNHQIRTGVVKMHVTIIVHGRLFKVAYWITMIEFRRLFTTLVEHELNITHFIMRLHIDSGDVYMFSSCPHIYLYERAVIHLNSLDLAPEICLCRQTHRIFKKFGWKGRGVTELNEFIVHNQVTGDLEYAYDFEDFPDLDT